MLPSASAILYGMRGVCMVRTWMLALGAAAVLLLAASCGLENNPPRCHHPNRFGRIGVVGSSGRNPSSHIRPTFGRPDSVNRFYNHVSDHHER